MKCVMLVHDHNIFRESLALIFERYSDFKERLQAQSLAEADRILGSSHLKPDLVIVDLDLANEDSFYLIKDLQTSHPDVPVLAITHVQDAYRRDQAMWAGAAEVLTMDAALSEIVDVAKRLVDG
jgi:DNA-binding NarL/FixJ family response regulator